MALSSSPNFRIKVSICPHGKTATACRRIASYSDSWILSVMISIFSSYKFTLVNVNNVATMSNAYKSNWDALYNDCKISKFLSKSFPIFAPMSRKKEKEIVRGVTVESVGAEGKAVARIIPDKKITSFDVDPTDSIIYCMTDEEKLLLYLHRLT